DSDHPCPRFYRYSKSQRPIRSSTASAAPTAAGSARVSSDGNQLHPFAIDRDFDLMRIARGARNLDFKVVFRVDGKITANRQSTPCAEGEFVHTFLLPLLRMQAMDIHHDRHLRIADGKTADLPGSVEVALHRCR